MRAVLSVLLYFALAPAALALDIQVAGSASPATGLWLGDEVLVSTTVRNNGPGASAATRVGFSGEIDEIFYFQFVRSESPECDLDALDINPPRFNFSWTFPALAAGDVHTCVVRLVVFNLPQDGTARLTGSLREPASDTDPGNDRVVIDFAFGSSKVAPARAIPAGSRLTTGVLAAGLFAIGWLALASKRRGNS